MSIEGYPVGDARHVPLTIIFFYLISLIFNFSIPIFVNCIPKFTKVKLDFYLGIDIP